tara:strand:- start:2348 stop:2695 length:348 start_codon:yes stop_codon:yes gene_type:complete
MVSMSIVDAKTLLEDVLHYEYADSLLNVYIDKDSLNNKRFEIQKTTILKLTQLNTNQSEIIDNLGEVVKNKDSENNLKDDIIKQQDKEIKKQKILKKFGFGGSIVLPIIVLILLL